ncbi:metacaspase-1 [Nicotiana attenuata]|uniref:Metacaspase-1 n=1 Tax=Nicotiana attenuata TaxID=49451 RepID=A0A1J6IUU5_NICAT|nr:metacaspase-1 [Nicotiana attenuata]
MLLNGKDNGANPLPTRANMIRAFDWLLHGCKSDDMRFLFYAGHGDQHLLDNGHSLDEFCESINPLDFIIEGPIYDFELNERWLVRPLPTGAKLFA